MHDQHLHAERTQFPWRNTGDTADGEEIRLSPVEVCSLFHYLRRVLAPCQVVSRSSEPSTLRGSSLSGQNLRGYTHHFPIF